MCIRDSVRTQHPGDGENNFNDAETEKVIPKRINKLESPDDGNDTVKWLQKYAGEVRHLFNIINDPEVY